MITGSDGRTRRQPLAGGVVLGRDPTCDILLDDLGTSRRHACIRPDSGGYVLEDLGSKNGTLVNDQRCSSVQLRDGDEILLGAVRIVFRGEPQADSSTTSVVLADAPAGQIKTRYSHHREELVLPQERLAKLYNLAERLTRLRDRDELLNDVLNVCFEMLAFERGAIGLRKADGRGVDWPVVRNLRGVGGELTISRSVLGRALDHGERAVINDTSEPGFDPTISIVQLGIRSALCVPLQHHDEILGVIYGDRISAGTIYTDEDVDFLAGLGQLVSIGLINARLMTEQRARLRLEHEIHLARGIQQRLFPGVLPDRPELKIAVLNEPGRHVSGDYYDVIELPGGRVAILIADVTGEGVAASLLMANLQAAVRVTLRGNEDIGSLMGEWNRLLYQNTDASKFVTALVAVVEPSGRRITLANAGHYHPYAVRSAAGQLSRLEVPAGLPLGVAEEARYRAECLELGGEPCTIFCHTDGVIEALNTRDEQFTLDRMVEILESLSDPDPGDLIARMRSEITAFCQGATQNDDITMLALRLG